MASRRGPSRRTSEGQTSLQLGTAEDPAPIGPRVSWPRRVGLVIAFVALGGTVVLASGGLGGGGGTTADGSHSPAPSGRTGDPHPTAIPQHPPTAIPVIAAPDPSTVSSRSWTASVTIPHLDTPRRELQLRVYRNARVVTEVPVKRASPMRVADIPLRSGENRITAAFVSPGGEGPASEPVIVNLDDQPPAIDIAAPQNHAVINAETVDVRGTTEAGAKVTVRNIGNEWETSLTADEEGAFLATVDLAAGENEIQVSATDTLSNRETISRTVTRGSGKAQAQLQLTPDHFRLHRLPATMDVRLVVVDANGVAADGAEVTFSLSPPGQPTSTYQTTTDAGHASWLSISLPREGATKGDGLVTALVRLADGTTVQQSAPFTID